MTGEIVKTKVSARTTIVVKKKLKLKRTMEACVLPLREANKNEVIDNLGSYVDW